MALLLVSLTAACADPPEVRYANAVAAAGSDDTESFLSCFTQASAGVLRGMLATQERLVDGVAYLGDVRKILPEGEVAGVEVKARVAFVKIASRRGETTVRMVREEGQWVIDAMALPAFWEPLSKSREE